MRFIKKAAFLSFTLLTLSACGQRGPLYIPSDAPNTNQAVPPSSEADTPEVTTDVELKYSNVNHASGSQRNLAVAKGAQ